MKHSNKLIFFVSICVSTISLAADLKMIKIDPATGAVTQGVTPVTTPIELPANKLPTEGTIQIQKPAAILPQVSSPAALPNNGVQMQKAPMALPQATSPAALPSSSVQAVKPVGNFGGAKVIQFQKGITKLDLKTEPDSTVLITSNGQSITIKEIRDEQQKLLNSLNSRDKAKAGIANIKVIKFDNLSASKNIAPSKSTLINKSFAGNSNVAELVGKSCDQQGLDPKILQVIGDFTPGSEFTLKGTCFDSSGELDGIGSLGLRNIDDQFAPVLEVITWSPKKIIGRVSVGAAAQKSGLMTIVVKPKIASYKTASIDVEFTPRFVDADVSSKLDKCNSWPTPPGEKNPNPLIYCVYPGSRDFYYGYGTGVFGDGDPTGDIDVYDWELAINENCHPSQASGNFEKAVARYDRNYQKKAIYIITVTARKWRKVLSDNYWGDDMLAQVNYQLKVTASCPQGFSPL